MKNFFYTTILLATIGQISVAQARNEIMPNRFKAPWVGNSLNGKVCSGGKQGYGPFDYSKRSSLPRYNLFIVEVAHFTPKVERLLEGESSSIEGDLNYTLRAWPNHHKALLSFTRFQLSINNNLIKDNPKTKRKENSLTTPPECYFQRAIKFSPNDATVYSLYAYYLKKIGHLKKSSLLYEKALSLQEHNIKIKYSYALLLIKLKKFKEANTLAKEIYSNKKAPKGLMKILKKNKHWE